MPNSTNVVVKQHLQEAATSFLASSSFDAPELTQLCQGIKNLDENNFPDLVAVTIAMSSLLTEEENKLLDKVEAASKNDNMAPFLTELENRNIQDPPEVLSWLGKITSKLFPGIAPPTATQKLEQLRQMRNQMEKTLPPLLDGADSLIQSRKAMYRAVEQIKPPLIAQPFVPSDLLKDLAKDHNLKMIEKLADVSRDLSSAIIKFRMNIPVLMSIISSQSAPPAPILLTPRTPEEGELMALSVGSAADRIHAVREKAKSAVTPKGNTLS